MQGLNFLKRLDISNNQITDAWPLPSSVEILNISYNNIKVMAEEVCKGLRNITTIDVSNNKMESFTNFNYMHRIKRIIAKHNFVRQLEPIQTLQNIYEVDLEGNAIDSYKDFLQFIKGKNDLIIFNLNLNPIMVEVDTIEKFNAELI
jgi:Leucine-rich repeat (LRR) protein